MSDSGAFDKYRRWVVWAIVLGVVLYAGGSMWADSEKVGDEFARMNWWFYLGALLLTLVNYAMRGLKWHYLVTVLGIRISPRENGRIFLAGLSMTISPGKAGEMLKPYLVSKRTGVSMTKSVPALVAERLTDIIAIVILMALALPSMGGNAGDHTIALIAIAAVITLGLAVIASERLSLAIIGVAERLPVVGKIAEKIEVLYRSTRLCLAPVPLISMIVLSFVAWGLECVGFLLVFEGMGLEISLSQATFIYAAGTVVGGLVSIVPGGVGAAEGSIIGLLMKLPIVVTEAQALTAAMLIRIATLWMGVILGAGTLLGLDELLKQADLEELEEEDFTRIDTAEELVKASIE